jgi:hypothetical protein
MTPWKCLEAIPWTRFLLEAEKPNASGQRHLLSKFREPRSDLINLCVFYQDPYPRHD